MTSHLSGSLSLPRENFSSKRGLKSLTSLTALPLINGRRLPSMRETAVCNFDSSSRAASLTPCKRTSHAYMDQKNGCPPYLQASRAPTSLALLGTCIKISWTGLSRSGKHRLCEYISAALATISSAARAALQRSTRSSADAENAVGPELVHMGLDIGARLPGELMVQLSIRIANVRGSGMIRLAAPAICRPRPLRKSPACAHKDDFTQPNTICRGGSAT